MQNVQKVASDAIVPGLRAEASAAPPSGIVEVFHYGRDRAGVIPLWVGEGDLATPAFIHEAATRSFIGRDLLYESARVA